MTSGSCCVIESPIRGTAAIERSLKCIHEGVEDEQDPRIVPASSDAL